MGPHPPNSAEDARRCSAASAGAGDPACALVGLALRISGARAGLLSVGAGDVACPVAVVGPLDEDRAALALAGASETRSFARVPIGPASEGHGVLLLEGADPARVEEAREELEAVALALLGKARAAAACPLTGLLEGEPARARIEHTLAKAVGSDRQYALLIADIADFHAINSAFGRKNGDRILRLAAERVRRLTPDHALPFRVQGDVFGVFVEVRDQATEIETLVSNLANGFDGPLMLDEQEVTLHLVYGTAVFPHRASNGSELFDRALLALRRAQERRTGAEVFTTELEDRLVREVAVEQRLRVALAEHRLSVVYQPKVRLESRRFYAVEALCRWVDPELGFVSPGEFIPAAERAGLVVELGRQVLRQSLTDVARMRAVLPGASVSVNVAAEQLVRPEFVDEIVDELAVAGMPPDALELELTESSVIENLDHAVDVIVRLRAAGIRCSIDDFGTGYSSLAYLRRLPVDTLKLDRSFLADVCASRRDADLIQSIVAMAHVLDFDVVAEGIEEDVQANLLHALGCDAGQGYLFAKPSKLEEVLELLAKAA